LMHNFVHPRISLKDTDQPVNNDASVYYFPNESLPEHQYEFSLSGFHGNLFDVIMPVLKIKE
ncbi:MAG: hypothetical protein OXC84_12815, partial [Gammaproteobacteria bacterium]|nr:hypothetical protein [Gammaproteobacteria bacterium]